MSGHGKGSNSDMPDTANGERGWVTGDRGNVCPLSVLAEPETRVIGYHPLGGFVTRRWSLLFRERRGMEGVMKISRGYEILLTVGLSLAFMASIVMGLLH
jgi:hypothetical protein